MAETKDPFQDYLERPLTDEEKLTVHQWSRDDIIETNERLFKQRKVHDAGDPIDVKGALDKANLEVPDEPPGPTYVGSQGHVDQGPVVVEGEDSSGRAQLPRDHDFTVAVQDEEPAEVEEVDIDELTVDELKENLHELGESTSGNKAELQKRLKKALG